MTSMGNFNAYLRSVALKRDAVFSFEQYPFSIPAIRGLESLELHPCVTFFVGENGTGKSTLLEAIAIAAGFNAEGGSRNFNFATHETHAPLHERLRLVRGVKRPKDGFFLRAESFYNVATYLEKEVPQALGSYGGVSLHERSHGEAFMTLMTERFDGNGLYLLDEPEAALSPTRQLALLALLRALTQRGAQFIIATHSPIIMAYPDAMIYLLSSEGIATVRYEETEHYRVSRDFFMRKESMLRELMTDENQTDEA